MPSPAQPFNPDDKLGSAWAPGEAVTPLDIPEELPEEPEQ